MFDDLSIGSIFTLLFSFFGVYPLCAAVMEDIWVLTEVGGEGIRLGVGAEGDGKPMRWDCK